MASVTIENFANILKTISIPQMFIPCTALKNWSSYLLISFSVYRLTYLHLFSNLFCVSICHFLPPLPTQQSTPVHFLFTYLTNILYIKFLEKWLQKTMTKQARFWAITALGSQESMANEGKCCSNIFYVWHTWWILSPKMYITPWSHKSLTW